MTILPLNLTRWHKVWLSKPWTPRPVPGTLGGDVEKAVLCYCEETRRTARIHPLPVAHYIWEIG